MRLRRGRGKLNRDGRPAKGAEVTTDDFIGLAAELGEAVRAEAGQQFFTRGQGQGKIEISRLGRAVFAAPIVSTFQAEFIQREQANLGQSKLAGGFEGGEDAWRKIYHDDSLLHYHFF